MAKKYPKFLLSNIDNIKSKGLYVIHTQYPKFISKLELDEKRNIISVRPIDLWDGEDTLSKVMDIIPSIKEWFYHSGRLQSSNIEDILINKINSFSFLKNTRVHYTVEEAAEVLNIIFPTKTKSINQQSTSYGLKHLLERISEFVSKSNYKYCSNQTLIEAMKLLNFKSKEIIGSPNYEFNFSSSEQNRIEKLIRR